MATQIHDAPPAQERAGTPRSNWLLISLVALIAAAVGLGAGYLLFAQTSGAAVDADVEALLDDWWAAADAGDADAVLAMMPEGGTIGAVTVYLLGYDVSETPTSTLERSISGWASDEGPSPTGDPTVVGEYGVYAVAQTATWRGQDYIYIFRVLEEDGELLLSYVDVVPPVNSG
jgi:hypothetical protein